MKIGAMLVAATALALGACGGGKEPQEAAPGAGPASSQSAGRARAGDEAVAAVLESPGAAVASLWFEVGMRPVAGQPFALKLLASAAQPVPELRLTIEPQDLVIAPEVGVLELATANTPVAHELTVTAPQAGLFDLRVRLAAGEGAASTVYAIPLLVAAQ